MPAGRTLSLVGGTIDVGTGSSAQGFLLAPAGRVNLVSVASAGEATFNPTKINGPLNTDPDSFKTREINVDNFTRLGDINIRGGDGHGRTRPPAWLTLKRYSYDQAISRWTIRS